MAIMKNPLVSVLIPAHNEEKVIGKALATLQKIKNNEYGRMEVIVGLDGCTDRTEDVVRRFRFARIYKSPVRSGKAKLLQKLMRLAHGEIIIVHDADLYFVTNDNFIDLVRYFDDPKVGGVDDYRLANTHELPLLNTGDTFVGQFVREFRVKMYAEEVKGKLYAKENRFPCMVTIFRRSALPQAQRTICDDGERAIQLMRNGYRVAILQGDDPHLAVNYTSAFGARELLRHKVRGEIARRQVQSLYGQYNAGLFEFYLPALFYSLRRAAKIFVGVLVYWLICALGTIWGKTVNASTKKGWKLRMKR